jgi:UDPglucose--hexose-1-phosphate uridylyltransferase
MSEIRQNAATREWVIIAPERARRPRHTFLAMERAIVPAYDENCPFCPGNEEVTPAEIWRLTGEDGWRVRVVPNKYSALSQGAELKRERQGLHQSVTGVGLHEVLIETPAHNRTTAQLPEEHVAEILACARSCYSRAIDDRRIDHVVIFKNHGAAAGTSLTHPHWQIIGLPLVPSQVRGRVEDALRYFDDFGECVYCRMIEDERSSGVRVILETDSFITFCPYASASPYHTWILPKTHAAAFDAITLSELKDLAKNLREVLSRFYHGLEDPDFNLVLRSAPRSHAGVAYYHWYLSIVPHLATPAGFELGTGMFLNASVPEDCAATLRNVVLPER